MFKFDPESWTEHENNPGHEAYLEACDSAYAELTCVWGSAEFRSGGVTAICVARNEAERLPGFLAHYRRLGVRHIHVIDNASSDKTRAIASSWPDTTVWSANASYAEACFGQTWIGAVVRRHGLGKWVLNVDVDEHLVYDGMERHDINALCDWLKSREQKRLFAPLIDMYSKLAFLEKMGGKVARLWVAMRDKLRSHNVFDATFYFDKWGSPYSPNYRFGKARGGMSLEGGVRERVIAKHDWCLAKVPLSLWDKDTAYCVVHFPFPFRLNPDQNYGALLHFKFVGDFRQRVFAAIEEKQHWQDAYEYKLYERWLEEQSALFDSRYSVPYRGPASLIAQRLLLPIDWNEIAVNGGASSAAAASAKHGSAHGDRAA
jgi:hypothetical protein